LSEVAAVDDEVDRRELSVDGISAVGVGDYEDAGGYRKRDEGAFVELKMG